MTFAGNPYTGPKPPRCKTGQGRLRPNYLTNALFIRELMDGPCTSKDLVAATGMSERVIVQYLVAMHRKKCIHIAAWEKDASGKQSIRAFAFGEQKDAKKEPTRKSLDEEARAKRRLERAMGPTWLRAA